VLKYPDRCSQLKREREELQKALSFSRTRYSFHRSMHPRFRDEPEGKKKERKNPLRGTVAKATVKIDGGRGTFIPHEHVTLGEQTQTNLENQIMEITRKILQYEKDDKGIGEENAKELDVLTAPAFFGAEAIVTPDVNIALGTIVTDTVVQALVVHKLMFQAFDVTQEFLEKVKARAIMYPDDIELKDKMEATKNWEGYKAKQMTDIKKTKWNVKLHGAMVVDLPGGKSVVVEDMGRKGDPLRGRGL
jgi:hypothetical protein